MMIVAFGIGTGVDVNALLAKSLGQRYEENVAGAAGNGIFLALVICAVRDSGRFAVSSVYYYPAAGPAKE